MKKITFFFFLLVLSGIAVFYYGGDFENFKGEKEENICTDDAFLCPDGSYVSRSGAECKFAACPNQESFTGTLLQDSNGFRLITASPENGGEVSYAMPLEIKVSNILGQIVGRRVKITGTFLEGAKLKVDELEELIGDAGDPTLGKAEISQSVFINGVRITLNRIVKDDRCPANANCIRAGGLTANVSLKSNTDQETRDISSGRAPLSFDSYQISIENIEPQNIAGVTLEPESYLITFRVRSNE